MVVKGVETDDIGLIICEHEDIHPINTCKFQQDESVRFLFERDPLKLINYYNFTYADMPHPMQLHDRSVLIMDPTYELTMAAPGGAPDNNLENTSPMVLTFPKTTTLSVIKEAFHFLFKGSLENDRVIKQITLFNDTLLALMQLKALQNSAQNINWNRIFEYTMVILQLIIAPVTVLSSIISIYAIVRSIKHRRAKMSSKKKLNNNYKVNKSRHTNISKLNK
jgi:hypothetical protein